jgi:phage-related protein
VAGNQVLITVAGDSTSLERAFERVGSSATQMAGKLDKAEGDAKGFGAAMDSVGGAVGDSEGKFMGAADLLDGLGGAFGLPTEGATNLMRAFGDLSGGFEVVQGMMTSGAGKLAEWFKATNVASMATKVWTGIQAAFNAVMAANPVVLATIAIAALAAGIVVAYQKSETFRNIVQGAFNTVKGAAEGFWNFFSSLPDKIWGIAMRIKDVLVWPYRTAFNLIADAWNNTVGRLSFEIPSWVPGGLGGKGFSMPRLQKFHDGGIVPGAPGTEVPILAMAGERVVPAGQGAGGNVTIIVQGSVTTERELIRTIRNGLAAEAKRSGPVTRLI